MQDIRYGLRTLRKTRGLRRGDFDAGDRDWREHGDFQLCGWRAPEAVTVCERCTKQGQHQSLPSQLFVLLCPHFGRENGADQKDAVGWDYTNVRVTSRRVTLIVKSISAYTSS